MINLQFKTNSLKIGSSVSSVSLNYGRNLAKRPSAGSGKGNSCRLYVQCGKKYKNCTCIVRPRYLVITEIKLKSKGYKNEIQYINKSQGNFASMRCETAIRENYSLLICIKHVPSLKTGVMCIKPILSPFIILQINMTSLS